MRRLIEMIAYLMGARGASRYEQSSAEVENAMREHRLAAEEMSRQVGEAGEANERLRGSLQRSKAVAVRTRFHVDPLGGLVDDMNNDNGRLDV